LNDNYALDNQVKFHFATLNMAINHQMCKWVNIVHRTKLRSYYSFTRHIMFITSNELTNYKIINKN